MKFKVGDRVIVTVDPLEVPGVITALPKGGVGFYTIDSELSENYGMDGFLENSFRIDELYYSPLGQEIV